MGSFGDYLENKLLDLAFGGVAFSAPGTVYVGLSTTDPTDSGGSATEPSGGSYARVAVTNNTTNWPSASGGAKSNGTAITFPTATASWGTCTHFGVWDASSAGNFMGGGALTASKDVASGDTASFASGQLTLSLT